VKKVLLTGGNGFIAREIYSEFQKSDKFEIISTNRSTLDVSDRQQVDNFFSENSVDCVIHTAINGGKRLDKDDVSAFFQNAAMFQNLAAHSDEFELMINFGSGAEFDRANIVDRISEEQIFNRLPQDYYGLVKNLIARNIFDNYENIVNFRLFGCFGALEEPQRLIKSCHTKLTTGRDAHIHQNKEMDYIFVGDLCRVLSLYLDSSEGLPRDINLCYSQKTTLYDVAMMVKDFTKSKNNVMIDNPSMGSPYTGDATRLENLHLNLLGIEEGIHRCLKLWDRLKS
jgi:GDP-L-fucose synthase